MYSAHPHYAEHLFYVFVEVSLRGVALHLRVGGHRQRPGEVTGHERTPHGTSSTVQRRCCGIRLHSSHIHKERVSDKFRLGVNIIS
jgi:hypothetical protein